MADEKENTEPNGKADEKKHEMRHPHPAVVTKLDGQKVEIKVDVG